MNILSPEQIRMEENKANKNGLSFYCMMENAGRGCAERIAELTEKDSSVVILCGKGKNGGDGFVIARYLYSYGYNVTVIRMFDTPSDELSEQMAALLPCGVSQILYTNSPDDSTAKISSSDIIVDAIFGIGFKGDLPKHIAELFACFNRTKAKKIAIDIPSGLSADAMPTDINYKADHTLSMLCYKREHVYMPWREYCGRIDIIPIGFTSQNNTKPYTYAADEIRTLLPKRPFDAHKGTFGHALIIAGSRNMPGAAIIATKGALNSGAGLVTLAFPSECYGPVTSHLTENLMLPLCTDTDGTIDAKEIKKISASLDKYNSIAVGCGMSTSANTEAIISELVLSYGKTLIIDADGINVTAKNINVLNKASCNIIMTPHPAEMARLTGLTVTQINMDRENTAKAFAEKYNVILLLKGANTVVAAPDGRVYINPTGSPALARGGSGDLLTGIIAALSAQGTAPFEAACMGAYIHGLAGIKAEKKFTSFSATSDRIISCIPEAFSQIQNG